MAITEEPSDKTIPEQEDTATPLTRETLYALVWSEPMLKVAARYGVSSSYLARVCARMSVPRPERGYWAKLAVGKAKKPPLLLEAQPDDDLVWSRDGYSIQVPRALPMPPDRVARIQSATSSFPVGQHPLINGAKALFESGRLSREGGYLKPAKRLLLDLAVTKSSLDKALMFANQLFALLEKQGHRVVFAPQGEYGHREEVDEREKPGKTQSFNNLWSPARPTVVYVGTVAIGLTIIELSEEVEARYANGEYVRERDYVPAKRGRYAADHSWTTKKDLPTGRLCLQAYSPYPRAKWVYRWQETTGRDLSGQIKGIVKYLEQAAVEIARLVAEGARQAEIERQQWEVQRERWRREEEARRVAKALEVSRQELLQIIGYWAESNRFEQFFAAAERRAVDLSDDQRPKMLDRLKRAREMIGSIDALDHFMAWKSPDER